MKIVLVNHMFLDGGGREEHVLQIAKRLADRNHQVTIVTSDYTPSGGEKLKNEADKVPGLKVVTLKGFKTNVPPGRIHIPDLTEFLIDYPCDIIHAHGMGEQPAEDAFYVAKIKRIPFVFTLHFTPYIAYKKLHAEHVWKVIQKYHVYNMLRGSDKVLNTSPPEKADIMKYTGYHGRNFELVQNGFERPSRAISTDYVKQVFKKYDIPEGHQYVAYVGALTNPRKGAFEAIQAFRAAQLKHPNLHLILMGSWDTRLDYRGKEDQTRTFLAKLAKAKQVTVAGWVEDTDEYFAILHGADVFISPTTYECFGIALAEALYNKTPVITTDIGGCAYVVRKGKDGLLVKDPEDVESFTRKLVYLLDHPEIAERMGKSGHARISKLLSWDKTVDKLEKIYTQLDKKFKDKAKAAT